MGALIASSDPLYAVRLNRAFIIGRLMMPVYDVNSGGTQTVIGVAVDGDDIITSATTHYTASTTVTVLQRVTICNGTSTARQCSIHLVESGGSRTVSNRIYSDLLQGNETITLEGPFFLSSGDTLQSIGVGMSADDIALRADLLTFSAQPSGMTLAHATTNGSGIEGAALTASSATYYTAPVSKYTVVPHVLFCNTDSSARTVTAYIIESGGSVAGKKQILGQSLQPGETVMVQGPFVLDAGDTIRGLASGASVVTIRVTAVELD